MKQLKNYEPCEIEILPLTDVLTTSGGFDGDEDDFGYGDSEYSSMEW